MGNEDQYRTPKPLEDRIALHRRFADPEKDTFRAAWRLFPLEPGMRVLEVGCGTGLFWQHAAAPEHAAHLECVLTDRSPGMVERARTTLGDRSGLTLTEADVTALPFPDRAFDAVVCNFVLQFVEDPERAVAEMARVLRADGFAGITLPGRIHMRDIAAAGGAQRDLAFYAEDADAVLRQHFGSVEAEHLVDTMRVDEVEPLVAWLASIPWSESDHLERLREVASDAIRSDGHFPVRRATGLFVCRAPTSRASAPD